MKIIKPIIVTLFVVFSTWSFAQTPESSLFWEVSGNGLEKPSYIFATVKFIPAAKFSLDQAIEDKLLECEIFATETLMDHHARHELNKAAHLPHHESIKDYISQEEFLKLEKLFSDKLGISKLKFETVYHQFKPVLLSTTITRLSLGKDVKYYEMELMKIAHKKGLIVMGLETAEREIAAMETFELKDQVAALKHTIDNYDQQIADYHEMIDVYLAGDLHKTLEYTLHPSENNEVFRRSFFDERNVEFIPHMENLMKKGKSFFAIGAGHLADEMGVLNLLKEKGYTLKVL
jgi:uncharacterized protein